MNGVNFQISGHGSPALTVPYERSGNNGGAAKPVREEGVKEAARERDKPSSVTLDTVAEVIESYVPQNLPNTQLKIDHDAKADLFVYKAVDRDSGEVIRQYPADDILRFIAFYREREGLVVDSMA